MNSSYISKYELKSDDFLDACLPGTSPAMCDLRDKILRLNAQAAEVRAVLLLGDPGVGKTYIARVASMHRCWMSARFLKSEPKRPKAEEIAETRLFYVRTRGVGILESSGEPFREVNLPSLEGPLAASQLFGHKKGAFTGADKESTGFLGLKDVTDILLDEIGYATIEMQQRLLQVLQSGEFYTLGSTAREKANARIFVATNQNLERLVREGKFQEDLWWRLTDHVLHIPPLSERKESIELLAQEFLRKLNQSFRKGDGSDHLKFLRSDLQWAAAYQWPGNVRELEKTVGRWFFYRATRSMPEVHQDVVKYVPKPEAGSTGERCIAIDETGLRSHIERILSGAITGELSCESLEKLMDNLLSSSRTRCAELIVECIDQRGWTSDRDLQKLFKGLKLSSARSSLSRIRSGIAKRSNVLQ
jgi:DNA-binding NtrC family response regulator